MLITKQSSTLQVLLSTLSSSAVQRSRRSRFWWSMAAITSASVRWILPFSAHLFAIQTCEAVIFSPSKTQLVLRRKFSVGGSVFIFFSNLNKSGDEQTKSFAFLAYQGYAAKGCGPVQHALVSCMHTVCSLLHSPYSFLGIYGHSGVN